MCKMVSKEVGKDFASGYTVYKRKQHLHPKAWHNGLLCHCMGPMCAESRCWDVLGPRQHPDRAGQDANLQSEPLSRHGFLDLYLRFSPLWHLRQSTIGATLGALASQKRYIVTSQKPHVALLFFPFFKSTL